MQRNVVAWLRNQEIGIYRSANSETHKLYLLKKAQELIDSRIQEDRVSQVRIRDAEAHEPYLKNELYAVISEDIDRREHCTPRNQKEAQAYKDLISKLAARREAARRCIQICKDRESFVKHQFLIDKLERSIRLGKIKDNYENPKRIIFPLTYEDYARKNIRVYPGRIPTLQEYERYRAELDSLGEGRELALSREGVYRRDPEDSSEEESE